MHSRGAQSTQPNQAFTLAEVMMATVVTLVAVVGLISAVTMGSEMLDIARKQTVAMQIIRNEVDRIHLQSWAMITTLPANASLTINGTGNDFSTGSNADKQSCALTNYSAVSAHYNLSMMGVAKDFTLTLTKSTLAGRPNLFVLKYTVIWTGGNLRKTYSRSSTTYYGKNGLSVYYQR